MFHYPLHSFAGHLCDMDGFTVTHITSLAKHCPFVEQGPPLLFFFCLQLPSTPSLFVFLCSEPVSSWHPPAH